MIRARSVWGSDLFRAAGPSAGRPVPAQLWLLLTANGLRGGPIVLLSAVRLSNDFFIDFGLLRSPYRKIAYLLADINIQVKIWRPTCDSACEYISWIHGKRRQRFYQTFANIFLLFFPRFFTFLTFFLVFYRNAYYISVLFDWFYDRGSSVVDIAASDAVHVLHILLRPAEHILAQLRLDIDPTRYRWLRHRRSTTGVSSLCVIRLFWTFYDRAYTGLTFKRQAFTTRP